MKKTITAIGNFNLNRELKKLKDCNLVTNDISDDEELIECLEREKEIDMLFVSSNIIKHYGIDEFLKIIRKLQTDIKIYFFKAKDVECKIKEDENFKVFTSFEIDFNILKKDFEEEMIKNNKNDNSQIIAISGASGVGKSVFSTFFAKTVENGNKKILLIDFDLEQNQLRTILKIKKNPKYNEINELIINVNNNLDILCHLDLIFENNTQMDSFKIQEILKTLRNEYDLIIIDTSSNLENEYTKRIFYNCDNIIFLVEPNIIGVKKAKTMLEVIENDWKVQDFKIKLVLNKTNIYQISDSIIEELFSNLKLIGKIQYRDSYNLMINTTIRKREIQKEYEKIYKKISNFYN